MQPMKTLRALKYLTKHYASADGVISVYRRNMGKASSDRRLHNRSDFSLSITVRKGTTATTPRHDRDTKLQRTRVVRVRGHGIHFLSHFYVCC